MKPIPIHNASLEETIITIAKVATEAQLHLEEIVVSKGTFNRLLDEIEGRYYQRRRIAPMEVVSGGYILYQTPYRAIRIRRAE